MHGFGDDSVPAAALSLHGNPKAVIRSQPSSPMSQLPLMERKGSRYSLDSGQCFLLLVFEKKYSKEGRIDFIDYNLCFPPFFCICVSWVISSIPMPLIIIILTCIWKITEENLNLWPYLFSWPVDSYFCLSNLHLKLRAKRSVTDMRCIKLQSVLDRTCNSGPMRL